MGFSPCSCTKPTAGRSSNQNHASRPKAWLKPSRTSTPTSHLWPQQCYSITASRHEHRVAGGPLLSGKGSGSLPQHIPIKQDNNKLNSPKRINTANNPVQKRLVGFTPNSPSAQTRYPLVVLIIQPQAAIQGLQQLTGGMLLTSFAGHHHAGPVNFFGFILLAKLFQQLAGVVVGTHVVRVFG